MAFFVYAFVSGGPSAILIFFALVVCAFMAPETKGKSLEEAAESDAFIKPVRTPSRSN